jgi:hypothetical protein
MDDLGDMRNRTVSHAFFRDGAELPDEVTLHIFQQIEKDVSTEDRLSIGDGIRDYCSIAFTSRKGYALIRGKPQETGPLHKILMTYLFHHHNDFVTLLPRPYLESLIDDKASPRLVALHSTFQKLYTYQDDEIKRLKETLSPTINHKNRKNPRIKELPDNVKEFFLWQFETTSSENFPKTKLKRYLHLEKSLREINAQIFRDICGINIRDFTSTSLNETLITVIPINFQNSITRFTEQEAAYIHLIIGNLTKKIAKRFPGSFIQIHIDLSHNKLRWIPNELFSKDVSIFPYAPPYFLSLDISHNLLTYLPESMENFKGRIVALKLENNPSMPISYLKEEKHFIQGNSFTELPAPVYKFTNLKVLDHQGLGLKEEPSKIFEKLSNLSQIRGDVYDVDRDFKEAHPIRNSLMAFEFKIENPKHLALYVLAQMSILHLCNCNIHKNITSGLLFLLLGCFFTEFKGSC